MIHRFQAGNKFGQQFRPGNEHRWQPGRSGNPTGLTDLQRQWREAYTEALISTGSKDGGGLKEAAENAAKLVWQAARAGESWALLHLTEQLGGAKLEAQNSEPVRIEVHYVDRQLVIENAPQAELGEETGPVVDGATDSAEE